MTADGSVTGFVTRRADTSDPIVADTAFRLNQLAFGTTGGERPRWAATLPDSVGVAVAAAHTPEHVLGFARIRRFEQYFGGRAVRMGGVASVSVRPEQRRRGVGKALLRGVLDELANGGWPISVLYPATTPLYLGGGWEVAGMLPRWRVPAHACVPRAASSGAAVHELGAADLDLLDAGYRGLARPHTGHLARGHDYWRRLLDDPEVRVHAVHAGHGGHGGHGGQAGHAGHTGHAGHAGGRADDDRTERPLAGLAVWKVTNPREHTHDVYVSTLLAGDRDAANALLGMFAAMSSVVDTFSVRGPAAPWQLLLREPQLVVPDEQLPWMLRIVDAPAAVAARGFPGDARVELRVELTDGQLPANSGSFLLRIRNGEGRLTREAEQADPGRGAALAEAAGTPQAGGPGSAPDVHLDIGAFAALYTGWLDPFLLRAAGRLEADDRACGELQSAFRTGSPPTTLDYF